MRKRIIDWLQNHVSAKRLTHILGVEAFSIQLAKHYQVDVSQAAQAGLMHDLAKFFEPTRLLAMAKQELRNIDPICAAKPHLLHAEVGAIIAQQQFGVTNDMVLNAIRHHTLGAPKMSVLSCIVFVADAIEPSRGETSELNALRKLSYRDLYRCVQRTCDYKIKYLLTKEQTLHPQMVLTRNWALQVAHEQNALSNHRTMTTEVLMN